MKKPQISLLYVLTFLFAGFLTGFFILRNSGGTPIQVSAVPESTQAVRIFDTEIRNGLVNINTASLDELTSLPGIGEKLAERIILYRNKHGSFQSEDELLNVEGIGSGKLLDILDLITTGGR